MHVAVDKKTEVKLPPEAEEAAVGVDQIQCVGCGHSWTAGKSAKKCPKCDSTNLKRSPRPTKGKKTNAVPLHWTCETCQHEWAAPSGQKKCPSCDSTEIAASIEGAVPVHPSSTSTVTPAGIAANDPLASPPVAQPAVLEVDLSKIFGSPDNPRKSFPADELEEIALSIESRGLDHPLEVLPPNAQGQYEILDGERRLRALQLLLKRSKDKVYLSRWQKVRCVVKDMTRAQARDYRLTTFVRTGLNAIEQARALQDRLDAGGLTQEQLGKIVGLTQGAVANKLALLKGPAAFQAKIISGEITEKQGRELVREFAAAPEVLEKWAKKTKGDSFAGRDMDDFYELDDALASLAEQVRTTGWNAIEFKLTPELETELDVRKIGDTRYAFNVKRFKELQQAAKDKKSTRADRKDAAAKQHEKKLTPAEIKERAKKQAEIFNKRLYRYKIAWLQNRCVERLGRDDVDQAVLLRLVLHFAVEGQSSMNRQEDLAKVITKNGGKKKASRDGYWSHFNDYDSLITVDRKQLWHCCREALAAFVGHSFEGYHAGLECFEIEALAAELAIDVKKEWTLTEDFLELHNSAQLRALQDEWKMQIRLDNGKRSSIISDIKNQDANKRFPCPKELLETKAVRL